MESRVAEAGQEGVHVNVSNWRIGRRHTSITGFSGAVPPYIESFFRSRRHHLGVGEECSE
jgi:hypothetical protein